METGVRMVERRSKMQFGGFTDEPPSMVSTLGVNSMKVIAR